jgi:hypothetical protein
MLLFFTGREIEKLAEVEEHLKEVCGGETLRPYQVPVTLLRNRINFLRLRRDANSVLILYFTFCRISTTKNFSFMTNSGRILLRIVTGTGMLSVHFLPVNRSTAFFGIFNFLFTGLFLGGGGGD